MNSLLELFDPMRDPSTANVSLGLVKNELSIQRQIICSSSATNFGSKIEDTPTDPLTKTIGYNYRSFYDKYKIER